MKFDGGCMKSTQSTPSDRQNRVKCLFLNEPVIFLMLLLDAPVVGTFIQINVAQELHFIQLQEKILGVMSHKQCMFQHRLCLINSIDSHCGAVYFNSIIDCHLCSSRFSSRLSFFYRRESVAFVATYCY